MNLKVVSVILVLSFFGYFEFVFMNPEESLNEEQRKVARCIQQFMSLDKTSKIKMTDSVEISLNRFCTLKLDKVEELHKAHLGKDENAEQIIKDCLQEEPSRLYDEYKSKGKTEKKEGQNESIISEFTQFIKGFCRATKVVSLDELETFQCLKDCAVGLFKTLENEIAKLAGSTVTAEKKADDFKNECMKEDVHDINKLSKIGEKWLDEYDKAFEAAYQQHKIPSFKEHLEKDFDEYYFCSRLICATKREDIPFSDWIQNEVALMHNDIESRL